MEPSIDLRLKNSLQIFETVFDAAFFKEHEFAAEQVAVAISHLKLITEQLEYAAEFELLSLRRAQALCQTVTSKNVPESARAEMDQLNSTLESTREATLSESESKGRDLQNALTKLLRKLAHDQSDDAREIFRLVDRSEYEQSLRLRSMFLAMGQESSSNTVKPIDQMMKEFRLSYGEC